MFGYLNKYFWVGRLVTVVFCSFFTARIGSAFVSKWLAGVGPGPERVKAAETSKAAQEIKPPRIGERSQFDIIVSRNVFDSSLAPSAEGAGGGEEGEGGAVAEGPAVKTTLEVKLLGTLAVGEGTDKRSSAIIESPKAKAKVDVYRVGQPLEFAGNGKLVRVTKDRIEFMNGSRLEYAELEGREIASTVSLGPNKPTGAPEKKGEGEVGETQGPEGIAKLAEGKYVIDQREIDAALQNLDRLYTEIRAVPNFKDGKVAGLKLLSVRSDSLFAKLGLKRGDVLERINGVELDIKKGLEIFNQLKDQKSLTIDVVRKGAPQTFEYEIR